MEDKSIIEGNKLIGEFMGLQVSVIKDRDLDEKKYVIDLVKSNRYNEAFPVAYHCDWSWLMPVIEKISSTKIGDGITYVEYAYPRTFGMLNEYGEFMFRFNGFSLHASKELIKAAWLAVVEYIEHMNEQKSSNGK